MKKIYQRFAILSMLILLSTASKAQYFEIGAMGGISAYQGDLLERIISVSNARPAGGFIFRFARNNHIAFRAGLNTGTMTGDDRFALDKDRNRRNLSFRSRITEVSGIIEVNLFNFAQDFRRKKRHASPYTPIIFAGVSLFKFNPKALYHGQWVALQPLSTEGQGKANSFGAAKKYSLTQISFPMGVGFKVRLSSQFNMGMEAGMRLTMTDYLDDVSSSYIDTDNTFNSEHTNALSDRSGEVNGGRNRFSNGDQRGNPAKKDSYYFAGINLTYVFAGKKFPCFTF